jgi:hypothetical protein
MRAFNMPMPMNGNHQKLDWSGLSWLLLADTSPPPPSSMMLRAKAAKKERRDSRDGITAAASASAASASSPNTTHRHGICYTLWWYFLTRYSALSVWCYQLSRTGLFHGLIVIGVTLAMASSILESHNELYLDPETGTGAIRMRRARDNEDIVKMTKTLNFIAFVIFSLETLVKVGVCVCVCVFV